MPGSADRNAAVSRRAVLAAGTAGLAASTGLIRPARAQAAATPIKVAILTDMSSVYAITGGMGSVEAARMAIDEFGGAVNGRKIELLWADHQNKPDVGSAIARQWYDVEGVQAVCDMPNSGVTIAVMELAKARNKSVLAAGAGSSDITNRFCNAVTLQWTFDSYQMAASLAPPLVAQGSRRWVLLMPDYTFGKVLGADFTGAIGGAGGAVNSTIYAPLGTTDYGTFLLQAQQSGADILLFGSAGPDVVNCVKQASEFGLLKTMKLACVSLLETEMSALSLGQAQGIMTSTPFVPNRTPATRAWSASFARRTGHPPSFTQAGMYSNLRSWLQAIKDGADPADGQGIISRVKGMPVHDMFAENGVVRPDGLMVHDWYVRQVKAPAESAGPDDLYKIVATVPGAQVVPPLSSETACALLKS